MELEMSVGMSAAKARETGWRNTCDEGNKLKSTKGWSTEKGLDLYGFRVLPAGSRSSDGSFDSIGYYTYFWSSSPIGGGVLGAEATVIAIAAFTVIGMCASTVAASVS